MRKAARLAAFAVVGLLASTAGAQATLTLDNPTRAGVAPGATLDFTGTVLNLGAPVFIVSFAATSPFTFDAAGTVALIGAPIPPGGSVSATLFRLLIDPLTPPGTYAGTYDLFVGPDPTPTGPLQTLTADFSVTVSTAPEPAPVALLALGTGVLGAVGLTRRRAAR